MRHPVIAVTALPIAALLLAGCASPSPVPVSAPDESLAPVSLVNCGFELQLDAPPERIVAIKSTSTDLLVALGLEERIVGVAFQDEEPPSGLPVLAERMPSEEALLEATPDLVFSGWESAFTAEAAGDRAELEALGVRSYVSPPACKGEGRPDLLTVDGLFDSITEAGVVFGASDEAAELVAEQRRQLDAVPGDAGLSALWWSSGTDTPYVGAGTGAPQLVLDALGLSNIAGDIDDSWSPLNWESVIAADPDVIVLVDASWNTAESKKAFLASNPATASLGAVVNERYLVIPFAAGEAGVRTVPAIVDLAAQLEAL